VCKEIDAVRLFAAALCAILAAGESKIGVSPGRAAILEITRGERS
jgi:hypothetical protein